MVNDLINSKCNWKSPVSNIEYSFTWCGHCECYIITCPSCGYGSCSGSGCEKCHDDYKHFMSQSKLQLWDYLSEDEMLILEKESYLREFIQKSVSSGFDELDFEWLQPYISEHSRKLFNKYFNGDNFKND